MQTECYKHLAAKAKWVRKTVLEMAVYAKSGHISSAFSQTELLVALYHGGIMRHDPENPEWEDRDRFIISKGQGGIGLYPVLADCGYFPLSDLDNFAGPGSCLGVHAEWSVPGIEVLSGSLGHGLPIATGMAQVARMEGKNWLVFCLLGDAELYEGSNWEAALYAAHKGFSNLVCIVDRNQQGVLGFTDDIAGPRDGPRLNPIETKFEAFGFEARVIDGHSYDEISTAFEDVRDRKSSRPLVVVANTAKGRGTSVMEGKRMWHYRVPDGEDLDATRADLHEQENELN